MPEPPLLSSLPPTVRGQIAVAGPLLFGAVVGFSLGANAVAYYVLSAIGLLAAATSGYEHLGPRAGAARGLFASCLFGAAFLAAHALSGQEPRVDVPDPLALIALTFVLIGTLGGALGGRLRARHAQRAR